MTEKIDDPSQPVTQCPHCRTAFRISEAQLAQRDGMVRCGACRGIFNAIEHLRHNRAFVAGKTDVDQRSIEQAQSSSLNPMTLMPDFLRQPANQGSSTLLAGTSIPEARRSARPQLPASSPTAYVSPPAAATPYTVTPSYTPAATVAATAAPIPAPAQTSIPVVPTLAPTFAPTSAPAFTPTPTLETVRPNVRTATDNRAAAPPPVFTLPPSTARSETIALDSPKQVDATIDTETLSLPFDEPRVTPQRREPSAQGLGYQLGQGLDLPDETISLKTGNPTIETSAADDFKWKQSKARSGALVRWFWRLVCLLLAALLFLQALYVFRHEIAIRFPAMRPILGQLCAPLKCRVSAPERSNAISIEGAEFQGDPAHAGLYVFTATLRNKHELPTAYPLLIITLTGLNQQVLSRKIFAPHEYLPGSADVARGLAGNGDTEFKLFIDASSIQPVGFDVRSTYAAID